MKFFNNIKRAIFFWKKEPEPELYPSHFIRIVSYPVARSKSIKDEFTQEIQEIKKGKIINRHDYTEHLLNATAKVEELPVHHETYKKDEEFEFDTFTDFGIVKGKL